MPFLEFVPDPSGRYGRRRRGRLVLVARRLCHDRRRARVRAAPTARRPTTAERPRGAQAGRHRAPRGGELRPDAMQHRPAPGHYRRRGRTRCGAGDPRGGERRGRGRSSTTPTVEASAADATVAADALVPSDTPEPTRRSKRAAKAVAAEAVTPPMPEPTTARADPGCPRRRRGGGAPAVAATGQEGGLVAPGAAHGDTVASAAADARKAPAKKSAAKDRRRRRRRPSRRRPRSRRRRSPRPRGRRRRPTPPPQARPPPRRPRPPSRSRRRRPPLPRRRRPRRRRAARQAGGEHRRGASADAVRHVERQLVERPPAAGRAWLADVEPDVVCMQETKLADDGFPHLVVRGAGLRVGALRRRAGGTASAILVRVGLDDVVTDFADGSEPDPDARIITATCGGMRVVVSVYVPNGRALDDDHYQYKLRWLERLRGPPRTRRRAERRRGDRRRLQHRPRPTSTCTTRAASSGQTHVSEPERERLGTLDRPGPHRCVPPASTRRERRCSRGGTTAAGTSTRVGAAHRPRARLGAARRPRRVGGDRPQRPQGHQAERSRPGGRRPHDLTAAARSSATDDRSQRLVSATESSRAAITAEDVAPR